MPFLVKKIDVSLRWVICLFPSVVVMFVLMISLTDAPNSYESDEYIYQLVFAFVNVCLWIIQLLISLLLSISRKRIALQENWTQKRKSDETRFRHFVMYWVALFPIVVQCLHAIGLSILLQPDPRGALIHDALRIMGVA